MERKWKVLLIGGSSAVGKSVVARKLAEYYKVPLTEADDIRISLQQIANQKDYSDLFTFINDQNYLDNYSTSELVEKLIAVGKTLTPVLKVLIDKHIICNEPMIMEGDSILPELIREISIAGVQSIFLYDDRERIQERTKKRNRGESFDKNSAEKQADFSFDYGNYIIRQAKKEGLNLIKSSPAETLFERILTII